MLTFISVWRGKTVQISKTLILNREKLYDLDIMQYMSDSPFYLKLFLEEYQECFVIDLPLYFN